IPTVADMAAAAPPLLRAAPPTAPPSPTVILKISSVPPGAEIFDGARKLGVAPSSLELARSQRPLHLRFHLDGYDDGATDVVPAIDGEAVNIELQPTIAKKKPHTPHRPPPPSPEKAPSPVGETVGNPYHTK